MAHYVDGFVVPVPTKKIDAYRRIARKAGKIWMMDPKKMPFDGMRMLSGGFKTLVEL